MRPTDAIGESRDAYSTPTVFVHPDGKEELIVTAGDIATAHSLKDGAELWRHADLNLQKFTLHAYRNNFIQGCYSMT